MNLLKAGEDQLLSNRQTGFHRFKLVVSQARNFCFISMEQLFHQHETTVSPAWNNCFTGMKLTETSDLKILLNYDWTQLHTWLHSLSHKVPTSHPVDEIRDTDWGYTDRAQLAKRFET